MVASRWKAQHDGSWPGFGNGAAAEIEVATPFPLARGRLLRIPREAQSISLTLVRGGLFGLIAWAVILYGAAALG